MPSPARSVRTSSLEIVYDESGPPSGTPVLLMHGWPYGPRAYDAVVPLLAEAGCRTIVPYLRGFGPTRFLSSETPRSGQQAALGDDLRQLMDALDIRQAVLVGYDWGGRAACIAAALWPERVRALVTGNGYNIQDIANSGTHAAAEQELRYWYQYYFHLERGRAGLQANRREICRLLWRLWSPHWEFDEETFRQTAAAWDNPAGDPGTDDRAARRGERRHARHVGQAQGQVSPAGRAAHHPAGRAQSAGRGAASRRRSRALAVENDAVGVRPPTSARA